MIRILLALCLALPLAAQLTDEQKEEFLQTAQVGRTKGISVGITQPLQATLRQGDFEHDAQIQRIDEQAPVKQLPTGIQVNFRDYWGFNIAAYKLDRLLGLQMLPVAVERKYQRDSAAFAWWLDDIAMMERERWEKDIPPPDLEEWNRQMFRARVFNQLTGNTDPNLGNVLIDKNWKIWLVDYTRAFRVQSDLAGPEGLERIDRNLLARLRELNEASVKTALGNWLNNREQQALLKRRDAIVKIFEEKIAAQGEAAVLYD
jgi:hypothetical protein